MVKNSIVFKWSLGHKVKCGRPNVQLCSRGHLVDHVVIKSNGQVCSSGHLVDHVIRSKGQVFKCSSGQPCDHMVKCLCSSGHSVDHEVMGSNGQVCSSGRLRGHMVKCSIVFKWSLG